MTTRQGAAPARSSLHPTLAYINQLPANEQEPALTLYVREQLQARFKQSLYNLLNHTIAEHCPSAPIPMFHDHRLRKNIPATHESRFTVVNAYLRREPYKLQHPVDINVLDKGPAIFSPFPSSLKSVNPLFDFATAPINLAPVGEQGQGLLHWKNPAYNEAETAPYINLQPMSLCMLVNQERLNRASQNKAAKPRLK